MQAVVLLEPLLTAVAMRVARLVLLEPMLTIVHGRVAPVVLVEPLLTIVHGRVSRFVLPEPPVTAVAMSAKHVLPEPMLTVVAMHAKHVLITNIAMPVQPVVHILQVIVLSEPLLTVAMRVSRLVRPILHVVTMRLFIPLLTARQPHVLRIVLVEPLLTAGRNRATATFTKKLRKVPQIVVVIIGLLLSRRKSVMRLWRDSILSVRISSKAIMYGIPMFFLGVV